MTEPLMEQFLNDRADAIPMSVGVSVSAGILMGVLTLGVFQHGFFPFLPAWFYSSFISPMLFLCGYAAAFLLCGDGVPVRNRIARLRPGRITPADAMYTVKLFVFLFVLMLLLSRGMSRLGEYFQWGLSPQTSVEIMRTDSWGTFTTLGMCAVILVPVTEELVYRYFFFLGPVRMGAPPVVAAVGSALLFAALHGNVLQFPSLLCMGLLLQLAYLRTRSLLAPITMHAANNLCVFVFLLAERLRAGL